LAAIFLFSFHIVCFFSHRDLLLSAVAASLHYLPQLNDVNVNYLKIPKEHRGSHETSSRATCCPRAACM